MMGNGGEGTSYLRWRRTNPFKDRFELLVGSRRLAALMLEGIAITNAEVDAGGRRFIFMAEGVGSQRVRICDTSEGSIVAYFDRHWSGRTGTLRFAHGGRLEWRRVGRWRPTWMFADRFGNPLVRLRPDGSVVDYVVSDERVPAVNSESEVVLLLALGWFLLVIGGHAVPPRLEPAV